MALSIKGDWHSWINLIPSFPPNEGFFTIKQEPDPVTGAFDGTHRHPDGDFAITGTYTPATVSPPALDHMEFSGTDPKTKCLHTYRGDIKKDALGNLKAEGKRHRDCPPPPNSEAAPVAPLEADDDWVGTHGT